MSIDTVDDLHEAEDMIGNLTSLLETVLEFSKTNPYTGLGDAPVEVRAALSTGVALGRAYCRPSCDDDDGEYLCDDDCGCPCGHPLRKETT